MSKTCTHLDQIQDVTPSADGCEECLQTGDRWVHLRACLICGHVGCCDSSKNKHTTKQIYRLGTARTRPAAAEARQRVPLIRFRRIIIPSGDISMIFCVDNVPLLPYNLDRLARR